MLRKIKGNNPLPVDMTNFGASFKKARESKGISLDQIAKETRISTRFLAAIENEEFHLLPGGVFNKGFVRNFAESVGLDPDQALAEYDRLVTVREPAEILEAAAPSSSRNERRLYTIALAILAIAIAIFYVVTRNTGRTAGLEDSAPSAIPSQTPAPTAPQTEPTPQAAPALLAPEPEPPPAPTAQPQARSFTLDVHAVEQTWIKVESDGNTVTSGEILQPGMTRKYTAENSLYLSIGNAAGLTLKINDMPIKPLGKSGQVRSVTFTPRNIKDFIG
jgi:cytoskeletal protein RodZ